MKRLVLIVVLACAAPSPAFAQLDAARRALDAADFRGAIRAFDRAEDGEVLSHGDLVAIYEGRALARWASGAEERAREDLRRLGSIDPVHTFPAEAPPELTEAFATSVVEAGGGIDVTLARAPIATGSALSIAVLNDAAQLTAQLHVHVRIDGADWVDRTGAVVEVAHDVGARIEAYAQAIGPGGAILASEGSETQPVLLSAPPAPGDVEPVLPIDTLEPGPVPAPSGGDDTPLIVGVVVGASVLVALGVVLGVVFGTQGPSDQTQLGPPMVEF